MKDHKPRGGNWVRRTYVTAVILTGEIALGYLLDIRGWDLWRFAVIIGLALIGTNLLTAAFKHRPK